MGTFLVGTNLENKEGKGKWLFDSMLVEGIANEMINYKIEPNVNRND